MACALCVQGKAMSKFNPDTVGGRRRVGLRSHSSRLPIASTSRHIQSDVLQTKGDIVDGGRASIVMPKLP